MVALDSGTSRAADFADRGKNGHATAPGPERIFRKKDTDSREFGNNVQNTG